MIYSDCHGHWHEPALQEQISAIVKSYPRPILLMASAHPEDWPKQIHLAQSMPTTAQFHICCGLHPQYAVKHNTDNLDNLWQQLSNSTFPPVAMGEIGLDRSLLQSITASERPQVWRQQLDLLRQQLQIAHHMQLPIVLHCVHAHSELLGELRKHATSCGGIIHGFHGNADILRQYLELGFYISPSYIYTLKAQDEQRENYLRSLTELLPPQRLLWESDSCTQRNGLPTPPRNTLKVAAILSQFYSIDTDQLTNIVAANLLCFCNREK